MWHELMFGVDRRRALLALGFAVVGPIIITVILDHSRLPALLYLLAIIPAAYIGRLLPGLLATICSWGLMITFLRGPGGPSVRQPSDSIILVVFIAVAALVAVEEAARARGSRTQDRLEFLADVNRTWMASVDSEQTIDEFARLTVPRLADWCAIYVRSESDPDFRRFVAHQDPEKVEALREFEAPPQPHAADQTSLVAEALTSGRPVVVRRITDDHLRTWVRDEEALERLRELGLHSVIVVPLLGIHGVLGALALVTAESRRRYSAADLPFVEEMARAVASAIENARLQESQSRMAQTLQSSLLTTDIPEIPGVDVVVRYRPAGEGALVGGDFYDVFEAGENSWAVALGDVSGKGPEAAAVTGLVRYTVRAAIVREVNPSSVLEAVNRQILRQNVARFCTAVVARVDRTSDGLTLLISCGGHPPPLVYRREQRVETLESTGTLLGVWADPDLVDVPVKLRPGDAIVFYTDGIIERFERAGRGGDAQLVALLWETEGAEAERIADRIYDEASVGEGEQPMDDMALVVLGVRPDGESTATSQKVEAANLKDRSRVSEVQEGPTSRPALHRSDY
jgi:serine phosphatase RsbU (regulator of sigma subunit)